MLLLPRFSILSFGAPAANVYKIIVDGRDPMLFETSQVCSQIIFVVFCKSFCISQSRKACCSMWLPFNASVTSELSLVFIRSSCDRWRKSSGLSCCSDHAIEIPLKSIFGATVAPFVEEFFSILIRFVSAEGPKPREWLKSLSKQQWCDRWTFLSQS